MAIDIKLLKRLIAYIVDQLTELEGQISKIRIVKILYLIDIEFYGRYRRTLTHLDWIDWKYGPFAFAINDAVRALGYELEEEEIITRAGQIAKVFRVSEEITIEDMVNFATRVMIQEIIRKWAYEDTIWLLDYVYFETAPMADAQFGHRLSFESIPPYRPELEELKHRVALPEERVAYYRQQLANLRVAKEEIRSQTAKALKARPLSLDFAYRDAMEKCDREEIGGVPSGLTVAGTSALAE